MNDEKSPKTKEFSTDADIAMRDVADAERATFAEPLTTVRVRLDAQELRDLIAGLGALSSYDPGDYLYRKLAIALRILGAENA